MYFTVADLDSLEGFKQLTDYAAMRLKQPYKVPSSQMIQAGFTSSFTAFITGLLEPSASKRKQFCEQIWSHAFINGPAVENWKQVLGSRAKWNEYTSEDNVYCKEISDIFKLQRAEVVDDDDEEELTEEQQKLFEDF